MLGREGADLIERHCNFPPGMNKVLSYPTYHDTVPTRMILVHKWGTDVNPVCNSQTVEDKNQQTKEVTALETIDVKH